MRWPWQKAISLNTLIERLESAFAVSSGENVTPENCMRSPTVHSIVTAVSRRISVSPVQVMQKKFVNNKETKELQPDHPVAQLLARPNEFQTKCDYWLDATSTLLRHGKYIAVKGAGTRGRVRRLMPVVPDAVTIVQDALDEPLVFRVTEAGGGQRDFEASDIHYVRGPARDFVNGNSPVSDVNEAIGLEIAAEKFGASFFGNGAVPLLVFQLMQGFKGFQTKEEQQQFLDSFRKMFSKGNAHKAFMLPKGIEVSNPIAVENDKAQFLETRKHQRTVIAGAFGVPPHLVGDLERATFNNVEQQDSDFVNNVVLPVAQQFESAMERDLLTDADRRDGIIIRFNLDAIQRADFKTRQEGSKIQREAGVISANEWREREGLNPISDEDGGDEYIRPLNMAPPGDEPNQEIEPTEGDEAA